MVSANTQANTLGAVVISDGEVPRIFTAKAMAVVSGGDLISSFSGTANLVGSQISSYATSDVIVQPARDAKLFNGIALNNAASGATVSFARKGDYLVKAGGIISGGALVGHNASGGMQNLLQTDSSGTATVLHNTIAGRAITTSASGTNNYSLVALWG